MLPVQHAVSTPAAIEEEVAALTLDACGMILDCSQPAERLLGYLRGELVRRHVSLLVPHFENNAMILDGQINPRTRYLCHCGHLFEVLDSQGRSFMSEIHLFEPQNQDRRIVKLILCQ